MSRKKEFVESLLIRASKAIELGARELKASHTLLGGIWPTDDVVDVKAHQDYEEMVQLAAELRLADRGSIALTDKGRTALAQHYAKVKR